MGKITEETEISCLEAVARKGLSNASITKPLEEDCAQLGYHLSFQDKHLLIWVQHVWPLRSQCSTTDTQRHTHIQK